MPVQRRYVGFMRGKVLMDGNFPSSSLVQHADFRAVSERSLAVGNQVSDILDVGPVPDDVVGNVVADMLDHAVISHDHIVQGSVVNSAMFPDASRKGENFVERPQPDLAGKVDVADILRIEVLSHGHFGPVLATARLCLKDGDLLRRQSQKGFHFLRILL